MESTRRRSQILGIITLALVCFTFTAAPASAFFERGGFEPGSEVQMTAMERVSLTASTIQDSFFAFLEKLGAIFAGQEGSQILD